jgi:hypothetical protein
MGEKGKEIHYPILVEAGKWGWGEAERRASFGVAGLWEWSRLAGTTSRS